MCWMALEVEGGVDWMELTRAKLGVPLANWTLEKGRDRIVLKPQNSIGGFE